MTPDMSKKVEVLLLEFRCALRENPEEAHGELQYNTLTAIEGLWPEGLDKEKMRRLLHERAQLILGYASFYGISDMQFDDFANVACSRFAKPRVMSVEEILEVMSRTYKHTCSMRDIAQAIHKAQEDKPAESLFRCVVCPAPAT